MKEKKCKSIVENLEMIYVENVTLSGEKRH